MPTDTFDISTGGNDKHVGRFGSGSQYPPLGTITHDTTSTLLLPERRGANGTQVTVACMKWDTSSLPDDAIINSAILRAYVTSKTSNNNLSVTLDWYVFDGTVADFSHNALTTAHAGAAISSLTTGTANDFTLINVNNISKIGTTGLRLHISQLAGDAIPTTFNSVNIASYEHTTFAAPQLIITYALGGGDLVGAVGA